MLNNELPKRKHPRLKQYDYSANGYYFVTICCKDMKCFFGKITHIADSVGCCLAPNERVYNDTILTLSPYGQIAEKQLFALEERYDFVTIDKYVIMPNHIHAILLLEETAGASPRPTVMDIVCAYKSLTTRQCKKVQPIDKLFQTSFYEHVIRGSEDYHEIAEYIANNPKQWELDKLYSEE